ncbi:MAG: hypothetical protein JWN74_1941 [Acidobacteriaceae bacterium]|nr:hypothetical protein [Acidobacteriaceae bacterium]
MELALSEVEGSDILVRQGRLKLEHLRNPGMKIFEWDHFFASGKDQQFVGQECPTHTANVRQTSDLLINIFVD